jgi:hypothetical protein
VIVNGKPLKEVVLCSWVHIDFDGFTNLKKILCSRMIHRKSPLGSTLLKFISCAWTNPNDRTPPDTLAEVLNRLPSPITETSKLLFPSLRFCMFEIVSY